MKKHVLYLPTMVLHRFDILIFITFQTYVVGHVVFVYYVVGHGGHCV